jgi:hypothetical protein
VSMRRSLFGATAAAFAVTVLTGCGATVAEPTGEELFERAESLYLDFRETTNGVLAAVHDGPWEVGTYGMLPSGVGCGDGWKFDLTRTVSLDPAEIPDKREAVSQHLVEAGFEVEGMDLASGTVSSGDVIVRKQGVYSLLTVTLIDNGNVVLTATSPCQPGDIEELDRMMYGDDPIPDWPVPEQEAPSDPIFFGIADGKPRLPSSAPPAD